MKNDSVVLVIDRYEGDIRSTLKYQKMIEDNLPEGVTVVFMSDKDIRGESFDQVWIDEFASVQVPTVQYESESYDYLRPEKPYWQRGRW